MWAGGGGPGNGAAYSFDTVSGSGGLDGGTKEKSDGSEGTTDTLRNGGGSAHPDGVGERAGEDGRDIGLIYT